MSVHDDLGNRMKEYEKVPSVKLMKRTPVIIRLDGKSFHTLTKGFQKPFDDVLVKTMQETMKYLCENIQGCIFGYTQSDEITLVLTDYATFETSAWFNYEVQKLCSISASTTTFAFNKFFNINIEKWKEKKFSFETNKLNIIYNKALEKGAMFDARCFNISKEEVTNCIYWRQLDAKRNSILSMGQAYFSNKELQNKSCNMIEKMLEDSNNNYPIWNQLPTYLKWGTACIKTEEGWIIDKNMPMLKGEDRNYLEKFI